MADTPHERALEHLRRAAAALGRQSATTRATFDQYLAPPETAAETTEVEQ